MPEPLTVATASPPFRSRRVVATMFVVNGAVLASWLPHIPAVKTRHGLTDGSLGVVLLAMAVGAVCALPVAGWLVDRLGSRLVTAVAAIALCLVLPLPLLSPSVPLLVLSLILLGAANGLLDVSMNAQAVSVEQRYGRPIMASFHALFSLGGVLGATVASGAMWLGVDDVRHVAATAVVCLAVVAARVPKLVPADGEPRRSGPMLALPSRALLSLGGLAFLGLLAEGAMGDWSAVYLRDALATSPAVAATGFAAFSLTMAVGRFGGDWLVSRFGFVRVLRTSSGLAAFGLAVALLVGEPLVAIIGFGLVGLGISNVIPILFSSAGRVPGVQSGIALAAVATTGYLGFLAGPPLIGLAANLANLTVALGIVSLACGLIAAASRVLSDAGLAGGVSPRTVSGANLAGGMPYPIPRRSTRLSEGGRA